MAFEVRSTIPIRVGNEEEKLLSGIFTDRDWHSLLALAREHGFDPDGEYEEALHPAPGETSELHLAATQELAVALSDALRKETASPGEDESEDDTVQLGWVHDPAHGWQQSTMIRVGPPDRPELQVGWAHARQLGELAETGPVRISRALEPGETQEENSA